VALADDTHRISLTSLPTPLFEEPEDDARELLIKSQYQVKPARKSDRWIGLEILPNGILSSLSSGQINLHPFSHSGTTYTASVLSPLACVRAIPANSPTGPTQMALAGKDVEISVWDMERTFAARPKVAQKDGASAVGDGKTKKRKKDQLEEGEIWRAKHVSLFFHSHYRHLQPTLSDAHIPFSFPSATKQPPFATNTNRLPLALYPPSNFLRVHSWIHSARCRNKIGPCQEIRYASTEARGRLEGRA
jgi:hypothetical protein